MKATWTVVRKELLDLFRDRRTVMLGLLMGPILMPVLMVGLLTLGEKRQSSQMEEALELPVAGAEHAPNLVAFLGSYNIEVIAPPADLDQAIRDQDHDVGLVIPEGFGEDWRASRPATVELVHDRSRQDSRIPVQRVENLLERYGRQVGALRLLARGISPTVSQPVVVAHRDLSTPQSRAGLIFGILPYFLILIAFLGGSYLVIDATAGERERQSLEPLLATPAAREAIMSGKILAACVFGFLSLVLTLVGFKFGFRFAPDLGVPVDLSWLAVAKLLVILVPLLVLGTSLLTLIAASAKSVKEAQSYMGVLMLLPIIPTLVLMVSPVKNQLWMFATPLLAQNQIMLKVVRAELVTALEWGVYFGAAFGVAGLLWLLAARMYHREKLAISG